MPTVVKDLLYPGTYHLPDGRTVSYSRADCRHLARRLKDMLAAGLHVPAAWGHQDSARPLTAAEIKASRARFCLGHAQGASRTPEDILEVQLDVPSPEDARRLPSVRFVSPEISEDYVDSTGRLWPGKSITHIAVTGRPVQHRQKPFAVQMGYSPPIRTSFVRLSLGDVDMAKEDEDLEKDKEGEEGDDVAGGPSIKKVLVALKAHGIHLPDDTNESNILERLYVACTAMSGCGPESGEADNPEEPTEVTQPVSMSADNPLAVRLLKRERADLERRIKALFPAKVTRPVRDRLLAELKTVRLSLDGQGELQGGKLLARVEAYEELEGTGFAKDRLSADDGIREVDMPRDLKGGAVETPEDVEAAVEAFDAMTAR